MAFRESPLSVLARAAVLALVLLLLPVSRLAAADPSLLKYYELGVAEGLANDSVYCIFQDSGGFLWFGTFGGLSRYDGESFDSWRPEAGPGSLQASVVFALAEDGLGRLWVGTDGGGLARYDRSADSFVVLRAKASDPRALSSDRVLALGRDSRGRLWAGTGDGKLNLLDPENDTIRRIEASGTPGRAAAPVRCIVADGDGGVWAGTEGGGLLHAHADGRIEAYTHGNGQPGRIASDVVRSLLVDGAGRLWVGLGDGGIDVVREGASSDAATAGRSLLFEHARAAAGTRLPEEAVRALAEDPDGDIWVGWADSGLGRVEPETLAVTPPEEGEAAMVRTLFRDRSGLMWAGLKGGGTRTFNVVSAHFQRFERTPDGRPLSQVRGMVELPDGRVLAGTDGQGILALDARTGTAIPMGGWPGERSSRKVYALLLARDGSVYAGTDGGGLLRKLPDGTIKVYRNDGDNAASLSSDVVWSLLEGEDGQVWVGTEGGGLDLLDPHTGRFSHFRHDAAFPGSLRGSSVRSLYRDRQGRLWIGTWDGGLSRLDPGGSRFVNYLPDYPSGAGALADASVNCVLEDSEGSIWVGTGGSGLARLEQEGGAFRSFDLASGLVGNTVYGLLDDRNGLLWIATATGLSSFDRSTGTFFSYGAEDGLVSGGLSQNASLATKDGAIWVGGPAGVTRFLPPEAARATAPPPVTITSVTFPDGTRAEPGSGVRSIRLPWNNAGLSFRIAVLDYSAPERNRYAMKLEGRQASWTPLGYSNSGTLAPLSPGTYLLRVKGANGNGVWNEEGDSLAIIVEPPVWGQLWFRLCAMAFLVLLVAAAIGLRTRSLRRRNELLVNFARHVEDAREEERTNAAREVHDEIGQHLAILNLQAWWLKTHPDAPREERATRLELVQASIGNALSAVKSVATRLRPVALDALSFGETAAWYARDFEHRTGIACRAVVGKDLPRLTDAEATALFRVLQEALANVARHSEAHNATIRLGNDGDWVGLEVEDDGVGMDSSRAEAPDAFGIIGMRERCASLGGGLEVRSSPGRGTVVSARVPAAVTVQAEGAGGISPAQGRGEPPDRGGRHRRKEDTNA